MKLTLALLLSLGVIGSVALGLFGNGLETVTTVAGADRGPVVGSALCRAGGCDTGVSTATTAVYMDRHEASLRRELQGTGVQIRREGDDLRLVLPGNITFATGNADIRSDFFPVLNSVAKVLAEFSRTAILVTGHTDSTGSDSINVPLSERRADSIAMYLRSQKVARARIQSYGYGSRFPVASNDTPAGREQNRRVELELVPVE